MPRFSRVLTSSQNRAKVSAHVPKKADVQLVTLHGPAYIETEVVLGGDEVRTSLDSGE